MFERGYFSLGRVRGVSLRAHVLTILGALFFTGFRFEPGAWAAFFALILLHEAGHALVVSRCGLQVDGIDLHAFGGVCRWSGASTSWQRALIAWGGVLAQAVLLLATLLFVLIAGPPHSFLVAQIVYVFTSTNLWLIVLNLAPIAPLDGAEAWKIVGELRERWAAYRAERRLRSSVPPAFHLDEEPRARRTWRTPAARVSPEEALRIARAFEDAIRRRP
jgi:stage IV sporulation protein FB